MSTALAIGALVTATATCAAGKVALGGGGRITVSGIGEVSMRSSYPSATDTWTVVGVVTATLLSTATVTPYVLCSL